MTIFKKSDIDLFNKIFELSSAQEYENAAIEAQKKFLKKFPKKSISKLTIDEYVIGLGTDSFCALIEAKSRLWANIQGATSTKFGLYHGRTKSDSIVKYRPTRKFGETKQEAFSLIKSSLLSLIEVGKEKDFQKIDNNLLSQMVKAKVLSLYYPNIYINICSAGHISTIALALKLPSTSNISEQQHLILKIKLADKRTKAWSNPKYMQFLYHQYLPNHVRKFSNVIISKPSSKTPRKVNMEEVQAGKNRIGKISEKYALKWEKKRLKSLGYEQLVEKIEDRTNRPGYGYDFLSYTAPRQKRYIEVKTLGTKEGSNRFFLSANEFEKSKGTLEEGYYFYLVKIGPNTKPISLTPIHTKDIHRKGKFSIAVHEVLIDISK